MMVHGRRAVVVRAGLLAGVVLVGVAVAIVVGVPDQAVAKTWVSGHGAAGPALFVLLYALVTLMPVPKNVLSALAGLVFGLVFGVVLVYVAAILGALLAFALGRALGREAVERFTGSRVARVDAALSRHGLWSIIGVRLVPVLPFTAINYGAGLTAVRTRHYLWGTAIGILPGTVAYVALGTYGLQPGSWPFLLAAGGLVVLTAGGAVPAWRARHRPRPAASDGDARP